MRKIFAGKITHWSQLGIKFKGKIKVDARDNNSGTYDTSKSLVLGKKSPPVKTAKRFESNTLLSDSVSNDLNRIGFVGLAYVRKAKVLAISDDQTDAIKPAAFSVATEDYALARRLFLCIPENNPKPLAKEFAHFTISAAADKVVTQVGFVSQKINRYQPIVSRKAPDEYRKLIRGAERLSLNIRFNSGSIVPGNKALQNIKRLASCLSKPENKKRHIMLFGFADKNEVAPFFSLSVSVQRADIVANHLLKLHVAPFRVRGYG